MSHKEWKARLEAMTPNQVHDLAKENGISLKGIPTHADKADHLARFLSMGYEWKQIVWGGK